MKKVLIVATVQSHVAQFHNLTIRALIEKGYEVHVAARDNLKEKDTLQLADGVVTFDIPFARSPLSPANLKAYRRLKALLRQEQYDILYCHTPVGGVLSRLTGNRYRKRGLRLIYVSHGFHFFRGAPKKNWLLYYPIERLLARRTDALVTINREDYELAKRRLPAKEIYHVDGIGADFSRLAPPADRATLRERLGLSEDSFLLLSVGELNKNKNQIVILRALSLVKDPHILLFLAGRGPMEDTLRREAEALGIAEQVRFLGYTRDLAPYLYGADAFALMSYREGLGLAAIEAMYCGLPLLTSDRHGIRDYSVNGESGYLSAPDDSEALAAHITALARDAATRRHMGEENRLRAEKYNAERITPALLAILTKQD